MEKQKRVLKNLLKRTKEESFTFPDCGRDSNGKDRKLAAARMRTRAAAAKEESEDFLPIGGNCGRRLAPTRTPTPTPTPAPTPTPTPRGRRRRGRVTTSAVRIKMEKGAAARIERVGERVRVCVRVCVCECVHG